MLLPTDRGTVDLYQALLAYFELRWRMTIPVWACALLLAAVSPLAKGNSDTVNERIPVRKAELERHWGVDCLQAWQDLQQTLAQASSGGCAVSPHLRHEFKLCAFIHQPPGAKPAPDSCPCSRGYTRSLRRTRNP